MFALETDAVAQQRSQTDLKVRVSRRWHEAEGVVALELQAPGGALLPAWSPGAHIDVIMTDGSARQYSLCGAPMDRGTWRIAILREELGRGGSRWLHDEVGEGDTLAIRGPRNHFRLEKAPAYLFIAGGIGITPILPMLAAAQAAGAHSQLVYCGRSRSTMAFLDQSERYGDRINLYPSSDCGRVDLSKLLAAPRPETLIYCCGPSVLLDGVEEHSAHWPAGSLHMERFSARTRIESPTGDKAFEVELARSGKILPVPADQTLLSVLEASGADVVSSCSEGTCGACVVSVLDGTPDHRDSVLTQAERASGESIVICVSRCHGTRLVLDL